MALVGTVKRSDGSFSETLARKPLSGNPQAYQMGRDRGVVKYSFKSTKESVVGSELDCRDLHRY